MLWAGKFAIPDVFTASERRKEVMTKKTREYIEMGPVERIVLIIHKCVQISR